MGNFGIALNTQPIENHAPKIRSIRTLRQWIQEGRLRAGEQLPTDNELARLLGVSRTTVRAAIKATAESGLLGYNERGRRIVAAAPQKSGSLVSNTVVILTHIMETFDQNPTTSQTGWQRYVQFALVDAIRKAGLHALTVQIDLLGSDLIKTMLADPPSGLVVMRPSMHPSVSLDLAMALRDNGVPVVFNGFTDLAVFDTVSSDAEAGSYELTKWVIKSGRRRLLRVWNTPDDGNIPPWQRHRAAGFERAIAESGLELLPPLDMPEISSNCATPRKYFEMRVRLMAGYLMDQLNGSSPADALLALTDSNCSVLAAACRCLGKEPNEDVAIVGYDNYWRDCIEREWEPTAPVATVDKLNIELGNELMALLQARAEHKLPKEPQIRFIKPKVIITNPII